MNNIIYSSNCVFKLSLSLSIMRYNPPTVCTKPSYLVQIALDHVTVAPVHHHTMLLVYVSKLDTILTHKKKKKSIGAPSHTPASICSVSNEAYPLISTTQRLTLPEFRNSLVHHVPAASRTAEGPCSASESTQSHMPAGYMTAWARMARGGRRRGLKAVERHKACRVADRHMDFARRQGRM
jgi:hypothetical protein